MKPNKFIYLLWTALLLFSCDNEWLEVKRDQKLVVPQTLSDLQALLDNSLIFNMAQTPSLGEVSAADYYVTDQAWLTASILWTRNAYIWEKDIYQNIPLVGNGWDIMYRQVFYSNVVLEGLSGIERNEKNKGEWDSIKGTALFWRSWAFNHLAQLFCVQYEEKTAAASAGIPLPLESDVNVRYSRGTLKQTYDRILEDLTTAQALLPGKVLIPTRPSKAAGYALLARVYLQTGYYAEAYEHSNLAYGLTGGLIDYNEKNAALAYPFPQFDREVILDNSLQSGGLTALSSLLVDTLVLNSYGKDDLRKELFFRKVTSGYTFKGTYTGRDRLFSGLGTDEIFLIKMECAVRLGKSSEASEMLNYFMSRRVKKGMYVAPHFNSDAELLRYILLQRRLQLLYRGIRWPDLKRLNAEGHNIILTRNLNGKSYQLMPNSSRYVLPIPPPVTDINPLIVQNERE